MLANGFVSAYVPTESLRRNRAGRKASLMLAATVENDAQEQSLPLSETEPPVVGNRHVHVLQDDTDIAPPPIPSAPKRRTVSATSHANTNGKVVRMLVTAYCPCKICCGADAEGVTASGRSIRANGSAFVAADSGIPFGKKISIPGYKGGLPVPVLDRGGDIKGRRLDVFFLSHREARKWGNRWLNVTICEN